MTDSASNHKRDRPPLPRDAFRTQRAGNPQVDKPVLQPVVVTPTYDDQVAAGPRIPTAVVSETRDVARPRAERPTRNRDRNPFEDYGERAPSRPYALRLPDPIDLVVRQIAAEQRTHPLRIIDRALYDHLKRLGRLPPSTNS